MRAGTGPFWSWILLALTAGGLACAAGTAQADPGDIAVVGGTFDWCVSEDGRDGDGNEGACVDGIGLDSGVSDLAVSPDGKRLQVAGFDGFGGGGDSLLTFDRDRARGTVAMDPRPRGCVSWYVFSSCEFDEGGQLRAPTGIAISPDSQNVYVTAWRSNALSVFDYVAVPGDNDNLGPMDRKSGEAGCLTESATVGCGDVRGLARAYDVVVSPDGETVYTAGNEPNYGGIAVFDRAADGTLTPKASPDHCVNDSGPVNNDCADGNHVEPLKLAISADGKNLYAASYAEGENDAVDVFDINADGTITQKAGVAGCFTATGSSGACSAVPGLGSPTDVAVTPDGQSVFVTSVVGHDDGPVIEFNRDPETGALTPGSCFNRAGDGDCTETMGLYRPLGITATNQAVYVSSLGDSVSIPSALIVLNRDADDRSLNQTPVEGCWAAGPVDDCVELSTLDGVRATAVSPDGDTLYAGSGYGVTVFDRDDGLAPVVSVDSGPSGNVTETGGTFTFSADKPASYFECAFDSDIFNECESPQVFENVPLGAHTFKVRATDYFDRTSSAPATRSFTVVDSTPPDTSITGGPIGENTSTEASFTFTSDDATASFECSFDNAAFEACTSPRGYTGLALGDHTFRVRAVDTSGNADPTPASRAFAVVETVIPPTCETDPSLCPDKKVDATVTFAKVQKQKRGKIDIKVKVTAREAVDLKITGSVKKGKVKAGLKPVTRALKPRSSPYVIHVRAKSARAGRRIAAALLGGKRAAPKLLMVLTDGNANRLVSKPKIRIVGPRR
jgi:DNA-binding beta-propeller fold protein YncE